jgi:hypothetical protein
MTSTTFSASDLNHLQRQLSAWRRRQSGRPRLPEVVWSAATELAKNQGPSLVARTLRLDYYKLRQRLAGTAVDRTVSPAFVEVRTESMGLASPSESWVELADGTGARMTLRVRGEVATLVALAQSFWRRRR